MQATTNRQAIPVQKIAEASKTLGLSLYYLRRGCRDGSIPHTKSGQTFFVNIPALLRQLGAESGSERE